MTISIMTTISPTAPIAIASIGRDSSITQKRNDIQKPITSTIAIKYYQ